MNLFVLDKELDVIAIVDTYTSFIWTDRYQEAGDFELCMPMDQILLSYIKRDHYLWRNDSEHVMIIESIKIESDSEDGDRAIITGRSLESILDRRVIWGLKNLSGDFQDAVKTLLEECIISPSKPERKIANFKFEATDDTRITDLSIDTQYTGDNLYEVICALCKERNIGFKVTLENKQFVFSLYSGDDRSYDQFENPYVVFSSKFDNIIDSTYQESSEGLKNVTLVGGEGEGTERRYTAVGNIEGLERRELFTDARDISSDDDTDMSGRFVFSNDDGITLTNIVPNGSFEKDSDWSNIVYDSSEAYLGTRSSKLGPGTTVTTTAPVTKPIVGHKYYGRTYIKSQGDIQASDNRYELYSGDGPGLNFVFANNNGNFPNWTMLSSIVSVNEVNGESYFIRNFVVDAVNPCWTDGLMIVDLTEAFGKGNEPTKEWMDQNIPWFEDTYIYFDPKAGTMYANQVFNNSSKTFITNGNFNSCMVDVSDFAGRTISISIPKFNNASGAISNFATILVNSSKQYISTLKAWEKYDDDTTVTIRGSLETYEIQLPIDAKFIYTSMYSQSAINNGVYSGEIDDFECVSIKFSNAEYITMLRQRGSEDLAENTELVSFDGQAETSQMFKYGTDFFMGDIVNVLDNYGHDVKSRVVELITSENEDGSTTTYPTFATMDYSNPEEDLIPDDYTVLEYIQSTGTQYIDTGYKVKSTDRVEMTMEVTSTPSAQIMAFGSSATGNNERYVVTYIPSSSYWRQGHGNYQYNFPVSLGVLGKHTIVKHGNTCTIDDLTGSTTDETFTSQYALYLFARNTAGSAVNLGSFRLYSCQIYSGSTLVRSFYPVRHRNGLIGLYDVVGQAFYGNSGTGVFVGSDEEEPSSLPDGYTQKNYIESSGTQYIDTLFKPNQDTRVTMDIEVDSTTSGSKCLFGTRSAPSSTAPLMFNLWSLSSNVRFDYFGSNDSTTNMLPGQRVQIDANKNVCSIGSTTLTAESATGQTTINLYLFTINNAGEVSTSYHTKMKLYSCKIYDNGILVRDFIPCTNPSGVAGLYDVVGNTFYANAGTGSFTAG